MTEQQHADRTLKAMSRNGWKLESVNYKQKTEWVALVIGPRDEIYSKKNSSELFDPQADHDPYAVFPDEYYHEIDGRKVPEDGIRETVATLILCYTKPEDRFKTFCEMLDKYGVELLGGNKKEKNMDCERIPDEPKN